VTQTRPTALRFSLFSTFCIVGLLFVGVVSLDRAQHEESSVRVELVKVP
jgi:hypothetical protein